jgi:hypothetical protein
MKKTVIFVYLPALDRATPRPRRWPPSMTTDDIVDCQHLVLISISSECTMIFCEVIRAETLVELPAASRPSPAW